MAEKLHRRKIGDSWYEITVPEKGIAGFRKHGPRNWSYYIRNPDGSMPEGWYPGRELFAPTRDQARDAAINAIKESHDGQTNAA